MNESCHISIGGKKRCRFECEAAMSQLPSAVGAAALLIPVVVALVGPGLDCV